MEPLSAKLINWAKKLVPATGRLVSEIFQRRPHPEQSYRSCLGLLSLGRHYEENRLESACARAEHLNSYSYQTVKNILSAGLDQIAFEQDRESVPRSEHENIRGASHYEGSEQSC